MNTDTHWYDDRDELVSFVRWFWEGAYGVRGTAGEIIDCFEKPWHWDEEYKGFVDDRTNQS